MKQESTLQAGIRGRIRKRLKVLRMSMKKLDDTAGLGTGFTFDYLSGRKSSLTDEALEKMAIALNTSEKWLLTETGSESVDQMIASLPYHATENGSSLFDGSEIVDIKRQEHKEIQLLSLDIVNGVCVVREDGFEPTHHARIVDPEIFLPGNAYAMALAKRSHIGVAIKRAILSTGRDIWFILDNPKS